MYCTMVSCHCRPGGVPGTRRYRYQCTNRKLIDRRELAAHYFENYGVRVNNDDIERLTEKQLLIKLETRNAIAKENRSAIRI